MNKIIFVLSYAEGDLFIGNYHKELFPEDAKIIILDNGHQANLRDWATANGALYHETENNLGTTGGYNWFIRVGNLLNADRAVIMQADVEVLRPETFALLFDPRWRPHDFAYFPNMSRPAWHANGSDPDIGQLFSIDPKFWLRQGWLCDENFTVTHFESIDLYVRITSDRNPQPAEIHNLIYENSSGPEEDSSYFRYHSVSSGSGEHNPWFARNYEYWQQKWGWHLPAMSAEEGWQRFKTHQMDWANAPWIDTLLPDAGAMLHRWTLDPERNVSVGQVPYPVEHEVNRFYQKLFG